MEDHGMDVAASGGRDEALARINGPATALLVSGIVMVVLAIGGAIYNVAMKDVMKKQQEEQIEQLREQSGEEAAKAYEDMMANFEIFQNPLLSLIGVAASIFIVLGALKMKKLESKGMAMGAAIVAMVPCLSPCCILGLPIGIWALVVMGKDEVSSQFS